MTLLDTNQKLDKYYCNACNRILHNNTRIACCCNEFSWCVTCKPSLILNSYTNLGFCDDRCNVCYAPVCIECKRKDGFITICIKCSKSDKLLMTKKTAMYFTGKTVVITGRLKSMKRKWAESLIITSGGNAGSKLDRAKELGVRIITEEEFLSWTQPQEKQTVKTKTQIKEFTKKRRILL